MMSQLFGDILTGQAELPTTIYLWRFFASKFAIALFFNLWAFLGAPDQPRASSSKIGHQRIACRPNQ